MANSADIPDGGIFRRRPVSRTAAPNLPVRRRRGGTTGRPFHGLHLPGSRGRGRRMRRIPSDRAVPTARRYWQERQGPPFRLRSPVLSPHSARLRAPRPPYGRRDPSDGAAGHVSGGLPGRAKVPRPGRRRLSSRGRHPRRAMPPTAAGIRRRRTGPAGSGRRPARPLRRRCEAQRPRVPRPRPAIPSPPLSPRPPRQDSDLSRPHLPQARYVEAVHTPPFGPKARQGPNVAVRRHGFRKFRKGDRFAPERRLR